MQISQSFWLRIVAGDGSQATEQALREMMSRRAQVPWISAQVIMTSTAMLKSKLEEFAQVKVSRVLRNCRKMLHGKLSYSFREETTVTNRIQNQSLISQPSYKTRQQK
jgi:L-lactate permease